MPRLTKVTKNLKCKLTRDEVENYASQLAENVTKIQRKEEDKKSVASQYKSEIDKLSAEIHSLSEKVKSKIEYRDVECSVVYDWDKKEKIFYRNDINEEVARDIIEHHELQEQAELEAKKPVEGEEKVEEDDDTDL